MPRATSTRRAGASLQLPSMVVPITDVPPASQSHLKRFSGGTGTFHTPPQGPPEHTTPASSLWLQLWSPQLPRLHWERVVSVPVQSTSSSQMGSEPCPKGACCGTATAVPQPSCRQTTLASFRSQPSSQTVPHWCSWRTSTRPVHGVGPLTKRTAPVMSVPAGKSWLREGEEGSQCPAKTPLKSPSKKPEPPSEGWTAPQPPSEEHGRRDGPEFHLHPPKWWRLLHGTVWTRPWRPR